MEREPCAPCGQQDSVSLPFQESLWIFVIIFCLDTNNSRSLQFESSIVLVLTDLNRRSITRRLGAKNWSAFVGFLSFRGFRPAANEPASGPIFGHHAVRSPPGTPGKIVYYSTLLVCNTLENVLSQRKMHSRRRNKREKKRKEKESCSRGGREHGLRDV